jgi:hypothetical protein
MNNKELAKKLGISLKKTYGERLLNKIIKKHKVNVVLAVELQNMVWEIEDKLSTKSSTNEEIKIMLDLSKLTNKEDE